MQDKDKKKQKKFAFRTIPATLFMLALAALIVLAGYTFLAARHGFTGDDLIESIVGNLIGVLASFTLFDILYNKLTQDEYTRETSQQITRTLMGEPEVLDSFSEEDRKHFLYSTLSSILKDEDAVDMLSGNMEKYFDRARGARIRRFFDYTINLDPQLTQEYLDAGFPGAEEGMYYLIDEELKFDVKYLEQRDENFAGREVSIGFAYDKKSLDAGLLETGQDADFSRCIFNEDLVIRQEAKDFIEAIPEDKLADFIDSVFVPILRIDNSEDDEDKRQFEVDRKPNGLVLRFLLDFDHDAMEHTVSIYFKMPRLWNTIFEVTLVDPTKEPHIKLKYKAGMDVTMYSYLNKETAANAGACIERAGLYDLAIKNEWIYPKSGVVFHIRKKEIKKIEKVLPETAGAAHTAPGTVL